MADGEIFIGTSGWHYKHWTGTFYPDDVKLKDRFSFYQQHFSTVEINNSFYRLPTAETFERWRSESPDEFVFVIKANRYITHRKKLKEPKTSTEKFFSNIKYLNEKLGAILFQLPPSWKVNVDRFREFLSALPPTYRYAFEFRDHTWYVDDIYELLQKFNCAFCIYELAGHETPIKITSDFVYVRLHGPGDKYQGSYSEQQLAGWAKHCRRWQREGLDVFMYFDNDERGYAAHNALALKKILDV